MLVLGQPVFHGATRRTGLQRGLSSGGLCSGLRRVDGAASQSSRSTVVLTGDVHFNARGVGIVSRR